MAELTPIIHTLPGLKFRRRAVNVERQKERRRHLC